MWRPDPDDWSLGEASLVGVAAGLAALAVYLLGGLVIVRWPVGDALAVASVEDVGSMTLVAAFAVAIVAVPVAALLYARLLAPLATLALLAVGWLGLGAAQGLLAPRTVFGLALYAMFFAPLYLAGFLVVGYVEYRLAGRSAE